QMLATVRGYLRGRQCRPHLVRRYFDERHVRYAAK
ncbi:IS630 family transposase, partial [bacterium]|nr:IS630 family transposase [bacterium]